MTAAALLLDVAVVAIVVLAAARGWRTGGRVVLLRAAGLSLGLLAGLWAAGLLSDELSPVSHLALGVLTAVGGLVLGGAIATRVGAALLTRHPVVGPIDRTVGAVSRGLIAVVGCVLAGLVVSALGPPAWAATIRSSALLALAPTSVPVAGPVFGGEAAAYRATAPADLAALIPASGALPSAATIAAVDARAGAAVVPIAATGCGHSVVGSGFVVDGLVVTNAHVVRGADTVSVGSAHATVVLVDFDADLAVLRVNGLSSSLNLATSDAANGTSAVTVGFPEGGQRTATGAVVVQRMPVPNPGLTTGLSLHQAYRIRAAIQHGDSGSPLMDTAGNVIGVINALSGTDGTAGYAITVDELRPDLAAAARQSDPVSTGACR